MARITRILCVAEKPRYQCVSQSSSVSKAVSRMLSNDRFQASNTKNKYIKNYAFVSKWEGLDVNVVMTG
jgi:hypothetical protein